jgi:hypothetical protein
MAPDVEKGDDLMGDHLSSFTNIPRLSLAPSLTSRTARLFPSLSQGLVGTNIQLRRDLQRGGQAI